MEHQLEEIENSIPETPLRKPAFLRLNSDNTSVNTEELHTNDQDWDSYQVSWMENLVGGDFLTLHFLFLTLLIE